MKIIIAAVPGAGKTTVLKYVKRKIKKAKIVNMGDLIFSYAKKRYKIKSRDELRKKLSIDQQRHVQEVAAKKISKMKGSIFIDTHVAINTPKGYFPALSEKSVHTLKPEMIILLEFEPREVLRRRRKDKTRKRDPETAEKIDEHQKVNREFAFSAATHAESAVEIISIHGEERKPFDHAKKAAEEIVKLIKG